jgi:hypothetical protein
MGTALFRRFAPVIRALTAAELNGADSLIEKMRLAQDGDLDICYAPFEYINSQARLVILGITPGRTQMVNAIREARRQLDMGADHTAALMAAKRTGAFSGTMRPNLVAMLDSIGCARWLGIDSCDALFGHGPAAHLVQSASALRNPVFVRGGNYNGTPGKRGTPFYVST